MKEHPILFSTEMIHAILDGRKTETRRIVDFTPREKGLNLAFSGLEAGFYHSDMEASGWVLRSRGAGGCWNDRTWPLHCPYGVAGDVLWVRETWTLGRASMEKRTDVPMSPPQRGGARSPVIYKASGIINADEFKWKPSIFMPRWASRISLNVKKSRVERLWDISEPSAEAEGIREVTKDGEVKKYCVYDKGDMSSVPWADMPRTAKAAYRVLWDKINIKREGGKHRWDNNPWVWVVTFERRAGESASAG